MLLLLFLFLPRGNARTTLSESRSLFIPAISLYIINNLTRLLSPLLWVLLFLPCTACAQLSCIHTAHFAFDDDERMSGGHQDEGFHRRHLSTNSGSVQSHCFFFFLCAHPCLETPKPQEDTTSTNTSPENVVLLQMLPAGCPIGGHGGDHLQLFPGHPWCHCGCREGRCRHCGCCW